MIEYYEQLSQEEKEEITEVVQTLYRQTFLLERKFDKRSGRMQYTKEYRVCSKHLEFLKYYFAIAGIQLKENVHMGVIYIQGEMLWGEKLPRLATIYLLVLKLIYDEQMQTASSSSHVVTTSESRRVPCAAGDSISDRDAPDHRASEKVPDYRAVGYTGRVK